MSTTTKEQELTGKPRKNAKKLNLASAKIADGALNSPKSVYEIIGYDPNHYKTNDLSSYSNSLRGLPLYELQSEAQRLGITPGFTRDICIKRLEERFAREQKKFRTPPQTQQEEMTERAKELRQKTLDILNRRA